MINKLLANQHNRHDTWKEFYPKAPLLHITWKICHITRKKAQVNINTLLGLMYKDMDKKIMQNQI